MTKIALAMIVKGTKEEAELLDRCLESAKEFVDGIFITGTHMKGQPFDEVVDVQNVTERHHGNYFNFEWVNDFAAARNFSFAQVPKDYDYIFWLDADDVLRKGDVMRELIGSNKQDCYSMWYQYAHDEEGNITVAHQKVRIVKNDGSFKWVGKLHENLMTGRSANPYLLVGADVLHLSTAERHEGNNERNLEIALGARDEKDPRTLWNVANSLLSCSKFPEALKEFDLFLGSSQSEEEKYIAFLRKSEVLWMLKRPWEAIDTLRYAIGFKPKYPDAYTKMGQFLISMKQYEKAIEYLSKALQEEPPFFSIVVFNPRDYDYEPIRMLAECHYNLNRMDEALKYYELCCRIYPKNERLKELTSILTETVKKGDEMKKKAEEMAKLDDKALKKALEKLSGAERGHPSMCHLANTRFVRTQASGKDVAIFCAYTEFEWTPEVAEKKGVGGSEEAVIHLAKRWQKAGWNVTVYNSCGYKERIFNGVTYKPFWMFNYRDKWNVLIMWRHPMIADYAMNADVVLLDLHDMLPPEELTVERVKDITKICVKSQFHRSVYPNVSDDKFAIIPNGIDPSQFDSSIKKEKGLIINTSSPDRSLSQYVEIVARVKEKHPHVRAVWCYGWDLFDKVNANKKDVMAWKENLVKRMKEVGIEDLGRISHGEVAKLYQKAEIMLYPSEFAEISCISLMKAQYAGAFPITTDFAAMNETVSWGAKLHSVKDITNWSKPYQFDFAAEEYLQNKFVETVSAYLGDTPEYDPQEILNKYDWTIVAKAWENLFIKTT